MTLWEKAKALALRDVEERSLVYTRRFQANGMKAFDWLKGAVKELWNRITNTSGSKPTP